MGRRGTSWDAVGRRGRCDFSQHLVVDSTVELRGALWNPCVELCGAPWRPVEARGSPVELRGALWLPCVELRGAIVALAGIVICKDHHDSKISMMQCSKIMQPFKVLLDGPSILPIKVTS